MLKVKTNTVLLFSTCRFYRFEVQLPEAAATYGYAYTKNAGANHKAATC